MKRQAFGYAPDPSNLIETMGQYGEMRLALESAGLTANNGTVLEIGTGWFPTIPLCFLADGAQRVLMTDLNAHLDQVSFNAARSFLKQQQPQRFGRLAEGPWQNLALDYLTPFKPEKLADASLDLVTSRTVLEHIPPSTIVELLSRLRPKLRPGGAMVHCIDHSDHLEHRDKSISKINFLSWSESWHQMVNRMTREGENRLRHHEYPEVFASAGFDVLSSHATVHKPTADQVSELNLKDRFKAMSASQLATLISIFVIVPKSSSVLQT